MRLITCLLFLGLLSTSYAQEAPSAETSPSTTTTSSTSKSAKDRVVLKIGNAEITQQEFEANIGAFENEKEKLGGKALRNMGDDYASVIMLSQQALANKLDASPEVRRQLETTRLQVLSDAEFAQLMKQAEPSTEEISNYYNTHTTDYDEVQVRRLFIWKSDEGHKNAKHLTSQEVRARAEQIRGTLGAGGDIKKVAKELKDSNSGMLDETPLMFPRGELSSEMEKTAFAMKPGEWAEVQNTESSLMLIQLLQHRQRQLGEVSYLIQDRLQSQKMQAQLDELRKKAGVWLDEDYFGSAAPFDADGKAPSSRPQDKVQQAAAQPSAAGQSRASEPKESKHNEDESKR